VTGALARQTGTTERKAGSRDTDKSPGGMTNRYA
jgi:hypothetical protein